MTGIPYPKGLNTEVIDLLDPNIHCTSVNFPTAISTANGGLLGIDLPIICGGRIVPAEQSPSNQCFILKSREFKPILNLNDATSDMGSSSVVINNTLFYVGGKIDGDLSSKFVQVSLQSGIIEQNEYPYRQLACKIL